MYEHRVTVTSETLGQSNWTVSTTPTGRVAFLAAFGAGARRPYMAVLAAAGQWERGWLLINSGTLEREVVLENSAGTGLLQSGAGTKIDFAAGSKLIFVYWDPFEPAVPFGPDNSSTGTIDNLDVRGKGAVRFTGAGPALAGLNYGADGKRFTIVNAHAADALTIKHEAGTSTAANRFLVDTGADFSLPAGAEIDASYDPTAARWRLRQGGLLSRAGGTVSGNLTIGGQLILSGDISPSQITANQDDYNPTGLANASILRLTSDASRNITGLQGGSDGRVIMIQNVGSFDIVLKDDDSGSSAANRFKIAGDVTLAAEKALAFRYDATSSAWRPWVVPGGAGGGSTIDQGLHSIWMPAAAMTPRVTNGAAAVVAELATNKNILATLDFDTATQEFAQFTIAMPKSWDEGTLTFLPIWTAASGSGTVEWALQAVATSDDDAMDAAFGTEQTSADTLITANDDHHGPASSAITVAGTPAAQDRVNFQIKRNVSADTLGVDAKLIGIFVFYTVAAATDA